MLGKLKAAPAADGGAGEGGGGTGGGGDTSLPDPSMAAKTFLAATLLVALLGAWACSSQDWVRKPFVPSTDTGGLNFVLFAGFYIGAQVIERLMELLAPFLPFWGFAATDPTVKAAHIKADRGAMSLGLATLLGVGASCGFGLYFLKATGISSPATLDLFLTGVVIAAGTKPLHDFISGLQNKNTPETKTTA
jgi:hypothetical protein